MNKPDIQQLQFWCQYWILVAGLTVCERIGDACIGWLPMYGEAKLAFFVCLWFPKTKGTTYVYKSFFRPYVAKHETEIDRNLLELRTRAGDIAVLYWQRAASYGQTRVFEILQYIAAQSPPPRPAQPHRQGTIVEKPSVPLNHRSTDATQNGQLPSSSASTASSGEKQDDMLAKVRPAEDPKAAALVPTAMDEQITTPTPPSENIRRSRTHEESDPVLPSQSPQPPESPQPAAKDTAIVDERMKMTRTRSRKTRAVAVNQQA